MGLALNFFLPCSTDALDGVANQPVLQVSTACAMTDNLGNFIYNILKRKGCGAFLLHSGALQRPGKREQGLSDAKPKPVRMHGRSVEG